MTPYQFAFYSSGALEEEWNGRDFITNRVVSIVGTGFGGIIDLAIMAGGASILAPMHNSGGTFAATLIPPHVAYGLLGVSFFVFGIFAVSTGAALETGLSGAYAIMQYFGWDWGKKGKPSSAPLFHLSVIVMVVLGILIGITGIDPIKLTVITMAIGAIALPFNFLPLLIVANDPDFVGEQRNNRFTNIVAVMILALLVVVSIAAIPLMFLSGSL